jgi:hypothetical protein
MTKQDPYASNSGFPSWDSPDLYVSSDTKWRAKYRLLQSWYRESVIGAPPGVFRGRLQGNHLPQEWLEKHPHANFLTPEVGEYVESRVISAKAENASIEEHRLRSNLLSSMTLCFNLFGHLQAYEIDVAVPLSAALDLDIATVTRIEVEWAPNPAEHLDDKTAFDAYIEYLDSNGDSGFVGVETKYTESFSQVEYTGDVYTAVTESAASGFKPGAAEVLKAKATNQLWRNAMLVVSHRNKGGFKSGHVAVVHCEGDNGLERSISAFETQLTDRDSLLRVASLERVVSEIAKVSIFANFAKEFERRYLDLGPITAHKRLDVEIEFDDETTIDSYECGSCGNKWRHQGYVHTWPSTPICNSCDSSDVTIKEEVGFSCFDCGAQWSEMVDLHSVHYTDVRECYECNSTSIIVYEADFMYPYY